MIPGRGEGRRELIKVLRYDVTRATRFNDTSTCRSSLKASEDLLKGRTKGMMFMYCFDGGLNCCFNISGVLDLITNV